MFHRHILLLCIIVGLSLLGCMEEDLSLEFSGNECNDDSDCKNYEECQGGQCVPVYKYEIVEGADSGDSDGDEDEDKEINIIDSDGDGESADIDMDKDGDEDEADNGHEDRVCKPDNYRCNGTSRSERCLIDGSGWVLDDICGKHEFCFGGVCICESGRTRCNGPFQVDICSGTSWEKSSIQCESEEICLDGECVALIDNDEIFFKGDDDIPLVNLCESNNDCLANEYCFKEDDEKERGYCQLHCDIAGVTCPDGYYCQGDRCVPLVTYCASDSDCGIYEFCNIAPEEDEGTCKTYCTLPDQGCISDTKCDDDTSSATYGKCIEYDSGVYLCVSVEDCKEGEYCLELPNFAQGGMCFKKCKSDRDCGFSDYVCNTNGECVAPDSEDGDEDIDTMEAADGEEFEIEQDQVEPYNIFCSSDEDCPETQWCDVPAGYDKGSCADKCINNEDCGGPLICNDDGRCVIEGSPANCGGPCDDGYVCDQVLNICVVNCPICPSGYECDADSAPNCVYDDPFPFCINPPVCGPGSICCPGYVCKNPAGIYGGCMWWPIK